MTVHAFNSPEEYARVLAAARGAGVAVQELGDYTLVVPDQWKPPRPPKVIQPVITATNATVTAIETNAPSPTRTSQTRIVEKTGGGGEG